MRANQSYFGLYSAREIAGKIGERARDRRLALGVRQVDLAARAGLTISTLRRFEAGEPVGFEVVIRVASALRSDEELAGLFPLPSIRSVDDILRAQASVAPRRRASIRKRP